MGLQVLSGRADQGEITGKGNILPQNCPGALQAIQRPQLLLSSCGENVGLQEGANAAV